jgi:hypothetical protein
MVEASARTKLKPNPPPGDVTTADGTTRRERHARDRISDAPAEGRDEYVAESSRRVADADGSPAGGPPIDGTVA